MKYVSIRRAGLALATAALIGAGSSLTAGIATAQDEALVPEVLFTSIYLEQTCSGHTFSQDEWDRLAVLVREVAPAGPEGEYVLSEMQTAKIAARDLTGQLQCSNQVIQDFRDIYARVLKPAL